MGLLPPNCPASESMPRSSGLLHWRNAALDSFLAFFLFEPKLFEAGEAFCRGGRRLRGRGRRFRDSWRGRIGFGRDWDINAEFGAAEVVQNLLAVHRNDHLA